MNNKEVEDGTMHVTRPGWQHMIVTDTTSGIEPPFNHALQRRSAETYVSSGRDVVIALDVRDVGISGWEHLSEPAIKGTVRVMVKDGDFPQPGYDININNNTATAAIRTLLLLALQNARIDSFTDGGPGRSAFFKRMVHTVRNAILYDTSHNPELIQIRVHVAERDMRKADAAGTIAFVPQIKAGADPFDRWLAKANPV